MIWNKEQNWQIRPQLRYSPTLRLSLSWLHFASSTTQFKLRHVSLAPSYYKKYHHYFGAGSSQYRCCWWKSLIKFLRKMRLVSYPTSSTLIIWRSYSKYSWPIFQKVTWLVLRPKKLYEISNVRTTKDWWRVYQNFAPAPAPGRGQCQKSCCTVL